MLFLVLLVRHCDQIGKSKTHLWVKEHIWFFVVFLHETCTVCSEKVSLGKITNPKDTESLDTLHKAAVTQDFQLFVFSQNHPRMVYRCIKGVRVNLHTKRRWGGKETAKLRFCTMKRQYKTSFSFASSGTASRKRTDQVLTTQHEQGLVPLTTTAGLEWTTMFDADVRWWWWRWCDINLTFLDTSVCLWKWMFKHHIS